MGALIDSFVALEHLATADEALRLGLASSSDRAPTLAWSSGREFGLLFRPCLPSGALRDPELPNAARTLGLSTAALPTAAWTQWSPTRRLRLLAPNHSWALWAWSRWWVAAGMPESVTIIHVDAHDDLGTPPLALGPGPTLLYSPVSGREVALSQPQTVVAAIEAGLVGIGSFILPFLRALRRFTFLHVCPRDVPSNRLDGCVLGSRAHPWLRRARMIGLAKSGRGGRVGASFVSAYDLRLPHEHRDGTPILVDIDLDYFANDFDSNSSNPSPSATELVAGLVDRFLDDLVGQPWFDQVEVVTSALSPGFFPARLWPAALRSLKDHDLSPL